MDSYRRTMVPAAGRGFILETGSLALAAALAAASARPHERGRRALDGRVCKRREEDEEEEEEEEEAEAEVGRALR